MTGCLYNIILKYCKSGKDKTTANAIRALGYLPPDALTLEMEEVLLANL